MKIKNNKLIVVLGMHRSGTSAITRALQVMGVELGDRLMQSFEGNNSKGFWEDVDLNTLNMEMLSALGSDWYHLAPIEPSDVEFLRKEGYFLRATVLLRQKVSSTSIFGFKDPRVAKLLPFWKEVFSHCQFDVSYVMTVRHPLSVVQSLAKRDIIEAGQSYLLWFVHVITSLISSAGDKRVLVDYDRLMQSPDHELNRMAKHLDLEINPTELQIYKTEFLDQGLRHTVYDLNDLLLDDACPPIVREVYAALLDVASEKIKFDDLELQDKIVRWSDEFERLRSPLLLVDELLAQKMAGMLTVGERDKQVANLYQTLGERDGQIASLNQSVAERDGQIASLYQTLSERDGQIASLHQAEANLNQAVIDRDGQIASLNQSVTERDGQIASLHQAEANLNQAVIDRDGQIAGLNEAIMERDKELIFIFQSKSWKLTRPLRGFRRSLVSRPHIFLSKHFSSIARRLWYSLPSTDNKQKVKSALFRNLPTLLGWTRAYRDWKSFNTPIASGSVQRAALPEVPAQDAPKISEYVPLLKGKSLENKQAKLICFYLPQFHPIPENNTWWGDGFTEWSNVQPAEPQFVDHYQPHVPGELGYYSLLDPAVQRRQVELAKLYGIEGFCFYFYWFGGKRLLETPIQNYLEDSSLDLPFCLCWANENWSRRWDGLDSEILIAQQYSPEDDIAFIQYVSRYMRDSRYIRIDSKPLLLVYRPSLLPSAKKTAGRWRQWCRDQGIGEIYLAYTQSFETVDPVNYGFDAAIEFPPNNSSPPNVTDQVQPLHDDFACNVYDWDIFVERSRDYKKPKYTLFRGVCPSWDNTARRKNRSSILLNSSPRGYQQWLFNAIGETVERFSNPKQRLIFINAWNEWAEGAHLEPDQRYGFAYLEATRMALVRKTLMDSPHVSDNNHSIAVVIHTFYEDVFDEILGYLENIHSTSLKLYVTAPDDLVESIRRKLLQQKYSFYILPVNNHGRDILPFIKIMPEVLQGGHDLLIKVHTKKSKHRQDGGVWRNDIFEKLLFESALIANIDYLANNPEIGILGPTGHIVPMNFYWGSNATRVTELAARMGVDSDTLKSLNFVAGTMFIARTKAMIPLLNIALTEEDFEQEDGQVDGTLAHAIERLFSISAHSIRLMTTCRENISNMNYEFAESHKE
ncbi:MAG: glycoside hydrolase family 99-like domain-containing protein [Methylobacter sp.]|nr:glycoside hydrolase family 99-like domain-containing protein [Methylobacter sp.]